MPGRCHSGHSPWAALAGRAPWRPRAAALCPALAQNATRVPRGQGGGGAAAERSSGGRVGAALAAGALRSRSCSGGLLLLLTAPLQLCRALSSSAAPCNPAPWLQGDTAVAFRPLPQHKLLGRTEASARPPYMCCMQSRETFCCYTLKPVHFSANSCYLGAKNAERRNKELKVQRRGVIKVALPFLFAPCLLQVSHLLILFWGWCVMRGRPSGEAAQLAEGRKT